MQAARCSGADKFLCGVRILLGQAGEEVIYFVIPSEARNLSSIETQTKRDSSARSVPRNDKIVSLSADCEARGSNGGLRL